MYQRQQGTKHHCIALHCARLTQPKNLQQRHHSKLGGYCCSCELIAIYNNTLHQLRWRAGKQTLHYIIGQCYLLKYSAVVCVINPNSVGIGPVNSLRPIRISVRCWGKSKKQDIIALNDTTTHTNSYLSFASSSQIRSWLCLLTHFPLQLFCHKKVRHFETSSRQLPLETAQDTITLYKPLTKINDFHFRQRGKFGWDSTVQLIATYNETNECNTQLEMLHLWQKGRRPLHSKGTTYQKPAPSSPIVVPIQSGLDLPNH